MNFLWDKCRSFCGFSQPEASQVDDEREQPWAPGESGASNDHQGEEEEEEEGTGGPLNEVTGEDKGAQWMWGPEQRPLRGHAHLEEEEDEEEEENNNSSSHQEEEERTEGGEEHRREEEEREEGEEEEEEEDEDDEEMDQDSDEFEHSGESGREEEDEEGGEGEEGLCSPSLRNNVSAPSKNQDSGCTRQSSSKKVSTAIQQLSQHSSQEYFNHVCLAVVEDVKVWCVFNELTKELTMNMV